MRQTFQNDQHYTTLQSALLFSRLIHPAISTPDAFPFPLNPSFPAIPLLPSAAAPVDKY